MQRLQLTACPPSPFPFRMPSPPGRLGVELKALIALVSLGIPGLHFPLMCTVDYLGQRLSVFSHLPINDKTLIYGRCASRRRAPVPGCAAAMLWLGGGGCGLTVDRVVAFCACGVAAAQCRWREDSVRSGEP